MNETQPLSIEHFEHLCQTGHHKKISELVAKHQRSDPQAFSPPWLQWYRPFWWEPIISNSCILRRRGPSDRHFIRTLWADSTFMHRFHRSAPPLPKDDDKLSNILQSELNHSMLSQRAIHWIIERDATPVGVLSLTELNIRDRRAEILIGVKPNTPSQIPTAAMLMAFQFVFATAGLNKLVSNVHADNVHSTKSTLHLGFNQEGHFKRHVFDPSVGTYTDLLQFGILRETALSAKNQRLMRRLGINQNPLP